MNGASAGKCRSGCPLVRNVRGRTADQHEVRDGATRKCTNRFQSHTLTSFPTSPASAIFALAMTPTALTVDRFPALAPLPP